MSDEGLMTEDIEDCMSVVIEAITKGGAFALVGCHLRQELVVGDPRRGGQARLGAGMVRISSAITVAEEIPFRFSVT